MSNKHSLEMIFRQFADYLKNETPQITLQQFVVEINERMPVVWGFAIGCMMHLGIIPYKRDDFYFRLLEYHENGIEVKKRTRRKKNFG